LAGLLLGLWFERERGPQGSTYHIGYPDAWAEMVWTPNSYRGEIQLVRWSFGSFVAGVCALQYAVRLGRRRASGVEPVVAPDGELVN
jgi:hypothetical protein